MNQLSLIHVPQIDVRQWRALIAYRHQLVRRRTKIKNHIRDLLLREGEVLPRGRSAWTQELKWEREGSVLFEMTKSSGVNLRANLVS